MTPGDAQAHVSRADTLSISDVLSVRQEAARSYLDSVKLRPRDYALWGSLGQALDEVGKEEEALRALAEAVRLAPHYARPRWQLGNFLLRHGAEREAFDQLRLAARSDPARFPNLLDLAWRFYDGDSARLELAVRPETKAERLTLARFYIKQGRAGEALRQYQEIGGAVAADERRAMLSALLAAGEFAGAYQVWSLSRAAETGAAESRPGQINDGGFESEVRLNEPGFGWQIGPAGETAAISLDAQEVGEGRRSLRIDFKGASAPAVPLLSQLVLVEGGRLYRLTFVARTQDLVTGGPPVVAVSDASAPERPALAQTEDLKKGHEGWQKFTTEFTPPQTTRALFISLRRRNCAGAGPCPAFGHLWLDGFSLMRL